MPSGRTLSATIATSSNSIFPTKVPKKKLPPALKTLSNPDVDLVAIGGDRVVKGMGGLVDGDLDDAEVREQAFERAREAGYMEGDE